MRRLGGCAVVCSMGEEPGNTSVRKERVVHGQWRGEEAGLFANVLYVFCGTETNCMTWRGNKALTKAKTHMQPCEAAPKSFQTLWLLPSTMGPRSFIHHINFAIVTSTFTLNFSGLEELDITYLAASTKSFHEAGDAKSYWAVDGDR